MSRKQRLKLLKELIEDKKLRSQDDLILHLKENGYDVTQSTISRDLRHLGVVKLRDLDQNEYYGIEKGISSVQFTQEKLSQKFGESVIDIKRTGNLIVVKTFPGEAQGVAVVLDGMNYKELLGTVAGDDTILCIIDKDENAIRLSDYFKRL